MTSSSSARNSGATGETSSFSLWPLADLGPAISVAFDSRPGAEVEEEAYQRGYSEGMKAAQLDAEREILASLEAVRRALAIAQDEREEERRVVEENAYALAVAVARQILQRELNVDGSLIGELVTRAIETAGPSGQVEVRMCPDDLDVVQDELQVADESGNPLRIKWVPDTEVARGGCMVETTQRLVDGGIDTALARLYETLTHG